MNDYTTNNAAEGGNALFAGCAYGELGELYIFCYTNDSGDEPPAVPASRKSSPII